MFYTDDNVNNPDSIMSKLELYIEDIKIWMERNFLKLNDSKIEFIIFGSRVNLRNLSVSSATVSDCKITIDSSAKN